MLNKLLGVRKLAPLSHGSEAEPEPAPTRLGLRVVHAGGKMECYYMPIPAARIMDKYPSFVVARPDVFRRPWDSVIRPEEILYPGQKVLLVPRHTVRKLRWRFRAEEKKAERGKAEINEPTCDENNNNGDGSSNSSRRKKQVRFSGIDDMNKLDGATKEKRKVGKSVTWEPSLTSINETLAHQPFTR